MRIGWRSAKVDKALAHKEVHAEAARNYCGLRHRKADLRDVYRGGDYGGIQNYPQMVGPRIRPQTGR